MKPSPSAAQRALEFFNADQLDSAKAELQNIGLSFLNFILRIFYFFFDAHLLQLRQFSAATKSEALVTVDAATRAAAEALTQMHNSPTQLTMSTTEFQQRFEELLAQHDGPGLAATGFTGLKVPREYGVCLAPRVAALARLFRSIPDIYKIFCERKAYYIFEAVEHVGKFIYCLFVFFFNLVSRIIQLIVIHIQLLAVSPTRSHAAEAGEVDKNVSKEDKKKN